MALSGGANRIDDAVRACPPPQKRLPVPTYLPKSPAHKRQVANRVIRNPE